MEGDEFVVDDAQTDVDGSDTRAELCQQCVGFGGCWKGLALYKGPAIESHGFVGS